MRTLIWQSAIVFAAAGTCGQRRTTLRRLIVHERIADDLVNRLRIAFASLPIGNPLEAGVLVGPLVDKTAGVRMQAALSECGTLVALCLAEII